MSAVEGPRQRWAATATAAPFRWHYLVGNLNVAICGEYRFTWQPIEDFARPDAFYPCPTCVERDEAQT